MSSELEQEWRDHVEVMAKLHEQLKEMEKEYYAAKHRYELMGIIGRKMELRMEEHEFNVKMSRV